MKNIFDSRNVVKSQSRRLLKCVNWKLLGLELKGLQQLRGGVGNGYGRRKEEWD